MVTMPTEKNNGTPINKKGFEHLYPFTAHYLDINGLDYHYVDEGKGDPVIMVHGNPTWSFYFRHLIAKLSSGYRVLAPDHMGCGLSQKPGPHEYGFRLEDRVNDFKSFITHLDLDQKITLVVHDWGGMIAMAYAVQHPEKIGRLIVLNTAAFLPPNNKPIPVRLKLIRNLPWFAEPAVLGLNLFALGAVFMAPYKSLSNDVKKGLLAPYNCRHNRIATLKFVQDIPLTEADESYDIVKQTEAGLHNLSDIPMLILWGEHDFVFDMDYFKEWQRRFPSASAKSFSDAGHYILEDKPNDVLKEIQLFLKQNSL